MSDKCKKIIQTAALAVLALACAAVISLRVSGKLASAPPVPEPSAPAESSPAPAVTPSPAPAPEIPEPEVWSPEDHGALVISEAVLWNTDYSEQNGEYYDWVELKNASARELQLSDYYLSDDPADLTQYRLPEVSLEPGGLVVIFCSGDESLSGEDYYGNVYYHAPFALNSEGDELYVTDGAGERSDYMQLSGIPYGASMGRGENDGGFLFFSERTPGADNSEGFAEVSRTPETTVAQGVYNDVEALEVGLIGAGDIRYTLDGTEPTAESTLFEAPLSLTETTVIRAACFEDGKLKSDTASFSFIVNEGHSLPVVSMVCDPDDMFGSNGVYRNLSREDSLEASLSFFEEGGSFENGCVVKLHGAGSRQKYPKKSFKVTFSSRFGGDLEYDVFGDGGVSQFHSLILRGGNLSELQILRDNLATEMAMAVYDGSMSLRSRYCVLYLNGEYRGIYAFREAYSEQYVHDYTGAPEDTVEIVRAPVSTGPVSDLFNFIQGHSFYFSENYDYVSEQLDMTSVAYWCALEAYFNNLDIDGNIRYYRAGTEDPRWKMMFFDVDIGLANNMPDWGRVFCTTGYFYQFGSRLNCLMVNEDFRTELLEATADLYNRGFGAELARDTLDELLSYLPEEETMRDCQYWHDDYTFWSIYTALTYDYTDNARTLKWIDGLQNLLNLDDATMQSYFGDYRTELAESIYSD